MTLDEFIATCEQNGYTRWSISREHADEPPLFPRCTVTINGIFSISSTEDTLEDAIETVLSVVEAVHGVKGPIREWDAAEMPHRARRDIPRGGVS